MTSGSPRSIDEGVRYCSLCGNPNHDVEDGVLDCGHSLDDGAWLVLVDGGECHEDVGSDPCGAPAVAVREDPNHGNYYPVCKEHHRP